MQRNVGTLDRIVRVILGLGLLSLFVILAPPLHWLGLIGVVPLLTAAIGNCPLYSIIGVSTCPTKP
jgi:hypothetical protein